MKYYMYIIHMYVYVVCIRTVSHLHLCEPKHNKKIYQHMISTRNQNAAWPTAYGTVPVQVHARATCSYHTYRVPYAAKCTAVYRVHSSSHTTVGGVIKCAPLFTELTTSSSHNNIKKSAETTNTTKNYRNYLSVWSVQITDKTISMHDIVHS